MRNTEFLEKELQLDAAVDEAKRAYDGANAALTAYRREYVEELNSRPEVHDLIDKPVRVTYAGRFGGTSTVEGIFGGFKLTSTYYCGLNVYAMVHRMKKDGTKSTYLVDSLNMPTYAGIESIELLTK